MKLFPLRDHLILPPLENLEACPRKANAGSLHQLLHFKTPPHGGKRFGLAIEPGSWPKLAWRLARLESAGLRNAFRRLPIAIERLVDRVDYHVAHTPS